MSGIYIPNMEMPVDCIKCDFGWNGWCHAENEFAFLPVGKRRDDCPLVAVPDHGRLIDGDILQGQMKKRKNFVGRASDADCLVADAPTIIPADKEDADERP